MSAPKFTPGPWRIERCPCDYEHCSYYGTSNGKFTQGTGYKLDDARLIAAAPELYEALARIAEGCSFPADDVQRACRDVARAALAKARGEA